jgi:hypothetical protein
MCLALGIAAHLSLSQIRSLQTEQKAAKPLTTQFVKRAPRLTKPLELKKRPQPKRRQVQRQMVAVKARVHRGEQSVRFQPTQVLRGLARPSVEIGRLSRFEGAAVEPMSVAGAVEGVKETEEKIDLSLELLDVGALNTGKYHAMVIQDPQDKRDLRGFCRLSWLYIPRLHDRVLPQTGNRGTTWARYYVGESVRNLANAMNRYTMIDTHVGERVTIDSPEAFKIPWIFHLYFFQGYRLSDSELGMLGRYMVQGGFIFADASPHIQLSVASSHAENLIAALETQGIRTVFGILPDSHPMYHCYFDFTGPPLAGDSNNHLYPGLCESIPYLEGLVVGNRLTAVLSRKAYYHPWCGDWEVEDRDATRQFQFGVNLIVFALTQEGSITRRLMDSVR